MSKRKQNREAARAFQNYAASLGITPPVVPLWAKLLGGSVIAFLWLAKLAFWAGVFYLLYLGIQALN